MSPEKQREIASKGGKSVPVISARSRKIATLLPKQDARVGRCQEQIGDNLWGVRSEIL
jgi:hypothetical protein